MTAVAATPAQAFATALAIVAAGAPARDRAPDGAFPEDAVAALERAGALAGVAAPDRLPYAGELAVLRSVAAADLGVARILDGHLNAVERLRVHAEPDVRDGALTAIAAGRLRAGVWGADPAAGEGAAARLEGDVVRGVKVFCSGAGGLDRALVLVDDARPGAAAAGPGQKLAAWVDLTVPRTVEVDHTWFRGAGMRSSASHRVVFSGAPVLAVLGPPGALLHQPWFARDVARTAATWAGAADAAVQDALLHLAARPRPSELEALAAGRLRAAQHGLGLWLDDAARTLDAAPDDVTAGRIAAQLSSAIADAARSILGEAERAIGSRPAATGATLDRAGRDLRLFLLQHRLEPILAQAGREALEAATP